MQKKPKQGEIWVVDLGPTQGKEHAGEHSCIILQRDILNEELDNTVIIPLMKKNPYYDPAPPYAIWIEPSRKNKLDQGRWADVSQIRCVCYSRMVGGFKGVLDPEDFFELENAFYATFGAVFSGIDPD